MDLLKKVTLCFGGILILVAIASLFFQRKEKLIFVDELSIGVAQEFVKDFQQKHPDMKCNVQVFNTNFLFQNIRMGRLPDMLISFDTSYANEVMEIEIKQQKHPLQRDAMVLIYQGNSEKLWNRDTRVAVTLPNNALNRYIKDYQAFMQVEEWKNHLLKPHDFLMAKYYLQKGIGEVSFMLQNQAKFYKVNATLPYFHRNFLHYVVFFKE